METWSKRTLRQCLIDTQVAHLRVIARLWGLELKTSQPLEIAAELAEALTNPTHTAHVWQMLPAAEHSALAALLDAGGTMPAATFARRFGEIRPMGPGRLERESPWRAPISPAEGLWYRGLIYQGFAQNTAEAYPVFIIPDELRTALPTSVKTAFAITQVEPATPPPHHQAVGNLFLDDVTTILAFVHNEIVRPSPDSPSTWPEPARRALARYLRDPNSERLAFTLHLINHLGWTRMGDDGRLRLAAEPVTVWLKKTATESQATLVNAWRTVTDWNELWRLPWLQPDDTGKWHNDPTLARAALLRHLESLKPEEWVTVENFISAVKVADPDFQRPSGDYENWYIRDAASGAYLTGFESWDRIEGTLLSALLTGPAWWLGLVELGSAAVDTPPDVFRPATPEPPLIDLPPPIVKPDLTVSMPAARRFERFQLARVADLSVVDDPYVYRLTPVSLSRARQQRINVEKALDFLEGLSAAPLPQALQASLARWAKQGSEVWLERVTLLRVSDEALLQQIMSSPKTSRYVERVIGPTAAVVKEKDWPRLLDALAELGFLAEASGIQND
jgi:hypothetical protein